MLRAISSSPQLSLRIVVSGSHLSPEFGLTVSDIENDGFLIHERINSLVSSDEPDAIVKSMGLGLMGFAQYFARERPDIVVVMGDRFDMYAAALAALPFKIPVAHIHGGELTEGAIDDALRHSMTKLSHLHFVSTEQYAARVRQLGEEPWRVTVCGAPALDHLRSLDLLSVGELASQFGIQLEPAPLLVTFHPVTLEFESAEEHMKQLLAALDDVAMPVLFTLPNADTKGRLMIRLINDFVAARTGRAQVVANFGARAYFSMMRIVPAMIGNSSSGLIEAPSFLLPVVNIGNRQRGRVRGANVIDCDTDRASITAAIAQALQSEFRESLARQSNPYDAGSPAGEAIAKVLAEVPLNHRLITKRFQDF